ncbi:hypothetical protein [Plantactinospora sonchi]|uniref:Uncharacterized protein n=1 Tax=Plantactinospora sonchi TaxID=1544735 RepID=A0ABU7RPE5_9ACTN
MSSARPVGRRSSTWRSESARSADRSPRHSPLHPDEGAEAQWAGEAKIAGRAVAAGPITEGPAGDRFHADITEVVPTHLNPEATMLVIEWWTPKHGLRTVARE